MTTDHHKFCTVQSAYALKKFSMMRNMLSAALSHWRSQSLHIV